MTTRFVKRRGDDEKLMCDTNHKRRISRTVLTLRAASMLHQEIPPLNDQIALQEVVGDYGLALFAPLHPSQLDYLPHKNNTEHDLSCTEEPTDGGSENDTIQTDGSYFEPEIYPVQVEPSFDCDDPPRRILDDENFQQIVDEAIPSSLKMYSWKRIYSIAEHGDLFFTFLQKVESFKSTLLVIKTTKGNILGGFASEYWRDQDGYNNRNKYFGFGSCFLFSDFPKNKDPTKKLSFFKWTGENDYCQICDSDKSMIAMGGGNSEFGLILEGGFLRGSSGFCSTFGNPSLIPGIDGSFDILEFEVYGLQPLLPAAKSCRSSIERTSFSSISLVGQ